jgi:mono/diheme cytochrome c family protein
MRAAGLIALAASAALLATACGGPPPGKRTTQTTTGKSLGARVFADAGCGGCHTLSAAGSAGNIGPDLDRLKPARSAVAQQVRTGGGGMPSFAGQLSDEQIDAVAEFVSRSAGRAGS